MKSRSASRITRLRPRELARRPLAGETRSAKREVEAAIIDLSKVVRGREEREVLMETRVEEITPVLMICEHTSVEALKSCRRLQSISDTVPEVPNTG